VPVFILMCRLVVLLSLLTTSYVSAGTVVLTPTTAGTRIDSGSPFFGSYSLGWFPGGDPINVSRNFFVFDLSGVVGPITSATLRLENPASGYVSSDAAETFGVFDVTSPIAAVITPFSDSAVYTDLGTGTQYGSINVGASANGTIIEIPLNALAVTFLNGASGEIALGGALTTLALGPSNELLFWGSSNNLTRELVLETNPVPEPATRLLLAASIAVLALLHRYRK
jgi:hypothetical protein